MRQGIEIGEAMSMVNGIVFYSSRHEGKATITTIDELGYINSKIVDVEELKRTGKFDIKGFFKFLVMYGIGGIMMFLIINSYFTWEWKTRLFFFLVGLMKLWDFFSSRIDERSKKFHSAEHMAINSYEGLGRIPTEAEIRKFSRFLNKCGTNLTTQTVIYILLVEIMLFIPNIVGVSLFFLLGAIFQYLFNKGCLNFMQIFTTSKPTEKELKLAIEALAFFVEYEQQ